MSMGWDFYKASIRLFLSLSCSLSFQNPTAADFQMAFPLEAACAGRVQDLDPSIKAFVEKMHSRPAYKRGLEKGGPYSYA